jgi:hypothetical protein
VKQLSLCLTNEELMKIYLEADVWIQVFLTSPVVEGKWLTSRSCRFTPGERAPSAHWIGRWVGPRTGLDDVKRRRKLAPTGTRTPTPRPSRP